MVKNSGFSTGEKQIVFRGSFLLKDKLSSKGALILIDEPEISLHPSWQLKILNFFKKLFIDEDGKQTSQLIIATHSPFIIHNKNRFDDKVLILQKDGLGNISTVDSPLYFSWSNEQIITEAFKMENILGSKKSTVFVEGKTDEKYFRKAIQIGGFKSLNFDIKWIGRTNKNGGIENSGDTALNQAKLFFLANMDFLLNKVVLLYDSEKTIIEERHDNLFIRKMTINPKNQIYKIGVENLLNIPLDFQKEQFYKKTTKIDNYGAESIINVLDKTKLCSHICNELGVNEQKLYLKNVIKDVEKIVRMFK